MHHYLLSNNGRLKNIRDPNRGISENMVIAAKKPEHINRKPASNLHHATRFAGRGKKAKGESKDDKVAGQPHLNLPLTHFVTINFTKLGKTSRDVSVIFQALRAQRFAVWLRRHPRNAKAKIPATYVWVHEGAGGQAAVHWAVHIPRGMRQEFRRQLPLWIASVSEARWAKHKRVADVDPVEKGIVVIKPIYNMTGLKRYMLKGVDPEYAALYKVNPVPQGPVSGQRSGFSRNLGPTARKAAGYKPKRGFPQITARG